MGKRVWYEIFIIYQNGKREKIARVKSAGLTQIVYREMVSLYARSHDIKKVVIV